jgi:hypothetical protein
MSETHKCGLEFRAWSAWFSAHGFFRSCLVSPFPNPLLNGAFDRILPIFNTYLPNTVPCPLVNLKHNLGFQLTQGFLEFLFIPSWKCRGNTYTHLCTQNHLPYMGPGPGPGPGRKELPEILKIPGWIWSPDPTSNSPGDFYNGPEPSQTIVVSYNYTEILQLGLQVYRDLSIHSTEILELYRNIELCRHPASIHQSYNYTEIIPLYTTPAIKQNCMIVIF